MAARVQEARAVLVLLDPLQLMGDRAADGRVQRARTASQQLPQALLEGRDRIHVQRARDRLLGREVMEQRAVGDAAALADTRDRRLLVAGLGEARKRGVEDAL